MINGGQYFAKDYTVDGTTATANIPGDSMETGPSMEAVEDPKLVGPGTGALGRSTLTGYRLLPESPARGTGKLIENPGGRDFWGVPVPSCGKTDRGASQSNDCN